MCHQTHSCTGGTHQTDVITASCVTGSIPVPAARVRWSILLLHSVIQQTVECGGTGLRNGITRSSRTLTRIAPDCDASVRWLIAADDKGVNYEEWKAGSDVISHSSSRNILLRGQITLSTHNSGVQSVELCCRFFSLQKPPISIAIITYIRVHSKNHFMANITSHLAKWKSLQHATSWLTYISHVK